MIIYTTKDGDTLDYICWKHYGHTKGVVEKVLEVNRNLANQPAVLEAGIKIELPEVEEKTKNERIKLWQ